MIARTILALLLLGSAVGVAFAMSRRWSWCSEGRRPHHRHWITRVLCGALGSAAVLAVLVATVRDARAPYQESAPVRFLLPTQPPPPPETEPEPDGGPHRHPLANGRFLLHVAVVTNTGAVGAPLHGESFEVRWPQDRDRVFQNRLRLAGVDVSYSVRITEIINQGYDGRPGLQFVGTRSLELRGTGFSSSRSSGLRFPDTFNAHRLGEQRSWLSAAGSMRGGGAALFDLTPVREGDPLRSGGYEDFLSIRGADVWRTQIFEPEFYSWEQLRAGHAPADALIRDLGAVLLVFLVASVLLAQLFRRRSLGFVKVAACLLLFTGALDRGVLRLHESRIRDASAPIRERLVACSYLGVSNFFRETALRDLEAAAADASSPAPLRELAKRLGDQSRKFHFP